MKPFFLLFFNTIKIKEGVTFVFPVTMMSLQCNEFLEQNTRHKGSLSCEQVQEKREEGRGREQMGGGGGRRRRRGDPTPTPTANL